MSEPIVLSVARSSGYLLIEYLLEWVNLLFARANKFMLWSPLHWLLLLLLCIGSCEVCWNELRMHLVLRWMLLYDRLNLTIQ